MRDNNNGGGVLGFLAFLATMFAAVLYLTSLVLSFLDVNLTVFETLQSIATVIMICIVSITGWRYVRSKSLVWRLIYVLILLAVVASVIVPVVIKYIPQS